MGITEILLMGVCAAIAFVVSQRWRGGRGAASLRGMTVLRRAVGVVELLAAILAAAIAAAFLALAAIRRWCR